MLKEEYDIEISKQTAEHYNADVSGPNRRLAKKWKILFAECRKKFLEEVASTIPEAAKSVRVRKLAKASRQFEKKGNFVGMADMLERIAKEVGNVHTNRRELTGKDGKPIQYQEIGDMTDDEIDAELAMWAAKVKNGKDVHKAPDKEQ